MGLPIGRFVEKYFVMKNLYQDPERDKGIYLAKRGSQKLVLKREPCANATEIEALQKLQHPHIVRFEDIIYRPKGHNTEEVYAAIEYAGDKTLDKLKPTEHTALRVGAQLAQALQHTHQNGYIYNDLKPTNAAWDERQSDGTVKLFDFESVLPTNVTHSGITINGKRFGTSCTSTPGYRCLDAIEGINKKSNDVFSLGCTTYRLLAGKLPYFDPEMMLDRDAERVALYNTPTRIKLKDARAETLVNAMIEPLAEQRPTMREVVSVLDKYA